jgi:hypothetical protein
LGRPTSCAGGEARDAPKPNERVYRQETETAVDSPAKLIRPRNSIGRSLVDEPRKIYWPERCRAAEALAFGEKTD